MYNNFNKYYESNKTKKKKKTVEGIKYYLDYVSNDNYELWKSETHPNYKHWKKQKNNIMTQENNNKKKQYRFYQGIFNTQSKLNLVPVTKEEEKRIQTNLLKNIFMNKIMNKIELSDLKNFEFNEIHMCIDCEFKRSLITASEFRINTDIIEKEFNLGCYYDIPTNKFKIYLNYFETYDY